MKVEDTSEHVTLFVPARRSRGNGMGGVEFLLCQRLKVGQSVCYSRGPEEGNNRPKDFCIALCSVIESRSIDQNDPAAVEIESSRRLYSVCARSQSFADFETGPSEEVDELQKTGGVW